MYNEVLSFDNVTLKLVATYGITTNQTITGSLISNGILYANYGINATDTIITTGNIYTTSGRIGVGPSPQYRLDIQTGSGLTGTIAARYFNYLTDTTSSTGTTFNDVCARFGSSLWVQSWIFSSSDIRIKEDIQDINDDSALQMILAIEPNTDIE